MNATRIILIDDDRCWLESLSEYLQRKGFSVLAAANPAEGLALLKDNDISLVICDYNLPGMTGLDLVRSIRQKSKLLPAATTTPTVPARSSKGIITSIGGLFSKSAKFIFL